MFHLRGFIILDLPEKMAEDKRSSLFCPSVNGGDKKDLKHCSYLLSTIIQV
jgi:hypothetical protein